MDLSTDEKKCFCGATDATYFQRDGWKCLHTFQQWAAGSGAPQVRASTFQMRKDESMLINLQLLIKHEQTISTLLCLHQSQRRDPVNIIRTAVNGLNDSGFCKDRYFLILGNWDAELWLEYNEYMSAARCLNGFDTSDVSLRDLCHRLIPLHAITPHIFMHY